MLPGHVGLQRAIAIAERHDRALQYARRTPPSDSNEIPRLIHSCAAARQRQLVLTDANNHPEDHERLLDEVLDLLKQYLDSIRCQQTLETGNDYTRAAKLCLEIMKSLRAHRPDQQKEHLTVLDRYLTESEQALNELRAHRWGDTQLHVFMNARQNELPTFRREFYTRVADWFLDLGETVEAWTWSERGRGRALLDALLEHVPGSVTMDQERSSKPTAKLIAKKESAVISPGEPRALDEVFRMADQLLYGKKLVVIDWHISHTGAITAFTIDSRNRTAKVLPLPCTVTDTERWIERHMRNPNEQLAERSDAIRDLPRFLPDVSSISEPGDLIVLTPPYPLAMLPLHAAVIETPNQDLKYLFEWCPVTYCSSVSLFRQTVERSCNRLVPESSSIRSAFLAAWEGSVKPEEQSAVYSGDLPVSQVFGSPEKIVGRDLTISSFATAVQRASWIHYHGHVDSHRGAPLDQSYVLSSDPSGTTTDERRGLLKVPDIMALDLSTLMPLIVSIACASSQEEHAPGNEPLGLVSAWFIASASSVLGTLWKVESPVGRQFSKLFYLNVKHQIDDLEAAKEWGGFRWVNIAAAIAEATLTLTESEDFVDTVKWAPFTLHGCPFYAYERVQGLKCKG